LTLLGFILSPLGLGLYRIHARGFADGGVPILASPLSAF